MFIGNLEQGEDAGALRVGRAAGIEVAAHSAGDAIFIHLADVCKHIAGLSAAVVPLLKELLKLRPVGSEAP